MTSEEIQKNIDDLRVEIGRIRSLIDTTEGGAASDISEDEKIALETNVQDLIAEVVWNRFLYESLDIDSTLTSSTTVGNTDAISASKEVTDFFVDFGREARFRTLASRNNTNDSLTILGSFWNGISGGTVNPDNDEYAAFELQSGKISAVAVVDGTKVSREIGEYEADTYRLYEMRFFPGERVDFYLDGTLVTSIAEIVPHNIDSTRVRYYTIVAVQETISSGNGGTTKVDFYEFMIRRAQYG